MAGTRPPGPTRAHLHRLKALRLRTGLSLDTVAERSGLPVAHVEALEEGRIDELPAGPYVAAYYKLVLGVVGGTTDLEEVPEPVQQPKVRVPLWAARLMAGTAVVAMLAAAGWQFRERGLSDVATVTHALRGGGVEVVPDLRVKLTARRESRFQVWVDGELDFDGTMANGVHRTFVGRDRIEVQVAGAETVSIEYNGQPVVPQGRQGVPRRLVFLDDLHPGD